MIALILSADYTKRFGELPISDGVIVPLLEVWILCSNDPHICWSSVAHVRTTNHGPIKKRSIYPWKWSHIAFPRKTFKQFHFDLVYEVNFAPFQVLPFSGFPMECRRLISPHPLSVVHVWCVPLMRQTRRYAGRPGLCYSVHTAGVSFREDWTERSSSASLYRKIW